MIKNEKNLFFLIISPVLVTGAFLLWYVLNNPGVQQFMLAAVTLAMLLVVELLAYRKISGHYIDPVNKLRQQLDEPAVNLTANEFDDGTPVQDLVLSLEQNKRRFIANHQDQIGLINHKNQLLKDSLNHSETKNESLRTLLTLQQIESENDQSYLSAITELCAEPLLANTGFTNMLAEPIDVDRRYLATEIGRASTNITFFIRELRQHKYNTEIQENLNIHQIVDNALGLINPIFKKQNMFVLPVFDDRCRYEIEGRPLLITATIFNFLLAHYINKHFTNIQQVTFQINFTNRSQLSLSLQPTDSTEVDFNLIAAHPENRSCLDQNSKNFRALRLNDLVRQLNAEFRINSLLIPVTMTKIPMKRFRNVTAKICASHHNQIISLTSRLENLGIDVTENQPDFCLICHSDHDDIIKEIDALGQSSKVLLLNNATLYQNDNWIQLKDPLNHHELVQILMENKKTEKRKLNLLTVDDNDSNLRLLTLLLTEMGHKVLACNDPMLAIDLTLRDSFDLIFMDLQMPGISGIQACEIIRSHGFESPIIALTAHLSQSERKDISQAGMNGALLKPVNKNDLRDAISTYLGETHGVIESTPTKVVQYIFDSTLALSRANNKEELAAEFLQLLVASLDADQDKLNQAYSSEDLADFRSTVHRINGALRYSGVPRLEAAIERLESSAKKHDRVQNDEIKANLSKVNGEIHSLKSWYEHGSSPYPKPELTKP